MSTKIGYSENDIEQVPEGANLGLGCGNPLAFTSLRQDQVVLDLGSGAGFDCFLASKKVGPAGKVIGLDMTPEMIEKAKQNAQTGNYQNVEFRLGEIEDMPVDSSSVDVIISNCVINLVPDKKKAFQETYRVLKPGGTLMISDVVLLKELPQSVKQSIEAYIGCLSGAVMKDEYLQLISQAGFKDVLIQHQQAFPLDVMSNDPTADAILDAPKISQEDLQSVAGATGRDLSYLYRSLINVSRPSAATKLKSKSEKRKTSESRQVGITL
jgi:ubiquinone/menaquinone biosynthesis C-methylase UbiE